VSQRNLVILLFVSLALNLFILGAAAGAYVFGDRMHHRRPEFHGGNPMMMAGSVLPDNEAQAYRDAVSAQVMAERQKVREARQIRHDALARLGADPVDPAAISGDLDRARALETDARGEIDHAIVQFAAKLPAADRAKLGAALSQPPMHRGGPHGPPGPGPRP
jgi:uncharacterized membrane protein